VSQCGTQEKVKKVSLLIKKCKNHLRKTEDEINTILDDFEEE
jgi:exonuclease VII small subunit